MNSLHHFYPILIPNTQYVKNIFHFLWFLTETDIFQINPFHAFELIREFFYLIYSLIPDKKIVLQSRVANPDFEKTRIRIR